MLLDSSPMGRPTLFKEATTYNSYRFQTFCTFIYICSGGFWGGGATDAPRSKFFHFHAAFGIHTFCKIIGWRTHLESWRTSPGKSATDLSTVSEILMEPRWLVGCKEAREQCFSLPTASECKNFILIQF